MGQVEGHGAAERLRVAIQRKAGLDVHGPQTRTLGPRHVAFSLWANYKDEKTGGKGK